MNTLKIDSLKPLGNLERPGKTQVKRELRSREQSLNEGKAIKNVTRIHKRRMCQDLHRHLKSKRQHNFLIRQYNNVFKIYFRLKISYMALISKFKHQVHPVHKSQVRHL